MNLRLFLQGAAVAALAALACSCTVPRASAAAQKSRCAEAKTQLAMTTCWSNLAKEAEARVEKRFQQLLAKVDRKNNPGFAAGLEGSQTKWREYRDTHCQAVEGLYDGGSMAPMQGASCRVRLAESRETELSTVQEDMAGLANQ